MVLHAIVDNILYEAITKSFIRDNYASQNGKGTHDGLMRLKQFMVDYYRREGTSEGWVLKCDVHHFFASIDHDKLKRKLTALLEKRGVDREIYELMCIYIDTTNGLPLGYQTSQLLALMFLDEFDHLMKEKYRISYYGRYMDDFFLIHKDKKILQKILKEIKALMAEYGLELNSKTGIFPLRNGIDYLGFHSYLTETGAVVQKLRQDSIDRQRSKIRYWRVAYPNGELTKEEIIKKFGSWDAHAAHGDTYALRRKLADEVEKIVGEKIQIHRKINSNVAVRQKRQVRQAKAIYKKKHKAPTENPGAFTLSERPTEMLPWE